MVTRRDALTFAFVGAAVGLALLGAVYALVEHWYASPISPLILLLTPGAVVGLFDPASSELHSALALAVQATTYALAAIALKVFHRAPLQGTDAV